MSIREEQKRYYAALYRRFGRDPRALGHRDAPTRDERFHRLARLFEGTRGAFSVHEIGAGLGDFGAYLRRHHKQAIYSASEISEEFLEVCRERFPGASFQLRDVSQDPPSDRYDFVTQSGIFNGPVEGGAQAWREFVGRLLRAMYAMADKGIAVNFLTRYGDPQRRRPELHYADPREVLDEVARDLSRFWEIDAAGPLYEFTMRVYRPAWVRARYAGPPFERYFAGSIPGSTDPRSSLTE